MLVSLHGVMCVKESRIRQSCSCTHHVGIQGNGGRPVVIPNLGIIWGEWSASCCGHCTPVGRSSCYPLNKRLGGSQSQSGWFGR
jgi:hypothetical protein